MIIDDSKTIRRSVESLLKKVGCTVFSAQNGFEALPIINENHPDILFVDIMMPRLDGYQTCSLIKNNIRFKNTPVIMLSSKAPSLAHNINAEQFISKPFSRDDILNAVRIHVLKIKGI